MLTQTSIKHKACGVLIALPLFVSVSGSGVSLPENYYEMSGLPLHLNIFALILLIKSIKFTRSQVLFIAFFLLYLLASSLQSFDRVLLAIQSIYFSAFIYVLSHQSDEDIRKIAHVSVHSLAFFCGAHILSIAMNSGGSVLNALGEGGQIWGLSIYQAYLTYPFVLIFGLLLAVYDVQYSRFRALIFCIGVVLIELILMRRTGLSFLIIFMAMYQRTLTLYCSFLVPITLMILPLFGVNLNLSEVTSALDLIYNRAFDGDFTRAMTWLRSLEYLTKPGIFLLGNGINNHSHNWFMHTWTTHGIFYFAFLLITIGISLTKFIANTRYAIRPAVLLGVLVIVDWNLNVNLYQPYYAGMLALVLVFVGRRFTPKTGLGNAAM